jgi:hypothetical protein
MKNIKEKIKKYLKINLPPKKRILILISVATVVWGLFFYFAYFEKCRFYFLTKDIDSLRVLISSIFQGLSTFFAIVISISLLVTQLTYGTFSPRLMPDFLKNRILVITSSLFIGALILNILLLSLLSPQTIDSLIPIILIDLIISMMAIIFIIPASLELFNLVNPMYIGHDLMRRFNESYFKSISAKRRDSLDNTLPLLQTITVKFIKEADTDMALRLIGSFEEKISKNINEGNYKIFADYFGSYIKKVSLLASEQNEEQILRQLMFMNEELEKKAMGSNQYLLDSWRCFKGFTFFGNIIFLIELAIKNKQPEVISMCLGSLYRLRKEAVSILPIDTEISDFIRRKHYINKDSEKEPKITDTQRNNGYIFEHIQKTYFDIDSELASIALEYYPQSSKRFIRNIYDHHYPFTDSEEKYTNHKMALERIIYSDLYNTTRITRTALKKGINLADEIASVLHFPSDHLLRLDYKILEGHINILGHLFIESIKYDMYDSDPESTIYSIGVVLRSFSGPEAPDDITIKLLEYLDKALNILVKKQAEYPSPLFDRIKENLLEEIETAKKWHKSSEKIKEKVGNILSRYEDKK